MLHLSSYRFFSQITPPPDAQEPAYWFFFQGDKLLVRPGADTIELPLARDPAELALSPLRQHYLGYLLDGQARRIACYCAELDAATPLPSDLAADGLRQLYPQLGDFWFQLAGRAIQIIDWDRNHQYCGRCGAPTEPMPNERARQCPRCDLVAYPRLSPAIIIAVVRRTPEGNRLLLARNHRFPPGRYSIIAGFVEPGESLEECAEREVFEEVGIQIQNIRYFGSQPWPFPNSLMLGFTADYAGGDFVLEEGEIADAGWFAADAMPQLPPKMSISRRLIDWFIEQNHPQGADALRDNAW
ncbi:MAG TPA: NAD(+) diphosphatase [Caldilineaceae bacterium]|nr:NAD(+) diphosphatase [Caldilineaceae bacterium]